MGKDSSVEGNGKSLRQSLGTESNPTSDESLLQISTGHSGPLSWVLDYLHDVGSGSNDSQRNVVGPDQSLLWV